ncbi:accessory gene regulator ArgB-like protein [Clostridium grantii]|uniref:Accessory gene regulator B n=1 Tax=Clostridium grantii DSM 8605 TaxID=1121316 RepID=A0A1M5QJZ2_9CLOT|nr:accessory gene regulator B family protein [Clostridium grantii]SHH14432.1 accessory gene regulator B [Clostridium grantii DSM 8605]
MIRMDRISKNIAIRLTNELSLTEENRDIVEYGAFILVQTIFSVIIVVLISIPFKVTQEVIILTITTSVLRKYSGGVHASSPGICTFIGTLICMSQALVIKYFLMPQITLQFIICISIIIFIWAYYFIFKLAPVDSQSKPIKKVEKRKRLKKISFSILNIYLSLTILSYLGYYFTLNKNLLIYSWCIILGVLWQVFTLTNLGHIAVGKVDRFFSYLIALKYK